MQNLLIFLGLIALAGLAYYLLVVQGDLELNTTVNESAAIESQIFVRQLNELKAVSFDTDIFSNPSFSSLQDQSAAVNPQAVGRSNPFSSQN